MLRRLFYGRADGDFNPNHENFLPALDKIRTRYGLTGIFAPRPNFTNRIAAYKRNDKAMDASWFFRTQDYADGGIVACYNLAIAFFNADCPLVAVREGERLAAIHAGFRCLWPRQRDARSIIKVLFEDNQFVPDNCEAFVGYGVGPCCYGVAGDPQLPEIVTAGLPLAKATRGPRAGQLSVDLFQLIWKQLVAEGVPEGNITIDFTCTACSGLPARPQYYSNCRQEIGRNAVLVWLV